MLRSHAKKKGYSMGDVVWAQTYKQPTWPATIKKVLDEDSFRVYFINDPTQAVVSADELEDYEDGRHKNIDADNTEKFRKAVRMADRQISDQKRYIRLGSGRKTKAQSQKEEYQPPSNNEPSSLELPVSVLIPASDQRKPPAASRVNNERPEKAPPKVTLANRQPYHPEQNSVTELRKIGTQVRTIKKLVGVESEVPSGMIAQLREISKGLSDITEGLMLRNTLGNIRKVLDALSTDSKYSSSTALIRSELERLEADSPIEEIGNAKFEDNQ